MNLPTETWFAAPVNRDVAAFIAAHPDLSAHSDVASELTLAAEGLSGIQEYCAALHLYRYVLLRRGDVIFALAYGMNALAFRIPQHKQAEARRDCGADEVQLGTEWLVFNPFRTDLSLKESRALVGRWCRAAYEYAATLR